MRPVRICMVTTFYPPYNFGGDGIAIQRLAAALARRGHEVTVIHDVDAFRALSPREPAPVPGIPGVEVVSLSSGLRVLSPLLTQQTGRPVVHGRRIQKILERGEFDVTFFHNISLVGGPGVLQYGGGIKIYEAHEHWLVCPSHVLWRHNREACSGRECLRCTAHYRRPPQLWRYTGLLERELVHVDAFIAKSEFSRLKHAEFGFSRDMEVVPCFLPDSDEQFPGASLNSPHSRPYFLFAGRLEKIKGLDDVIPAFRNYPEADLVISGEGEHAAHLKALAGDAANVHFVGRVPPHELSAYYAYALGLIAPSIGFETFGIVLIEALRHGTPVIARRIGPFPEIVEQAGAGYLFDDARGMLTAMRAVQSDSLGRSDLSRSAIKAFSAHWSESAVMPRYQRLIARLAESKGMHDVAEAIAPEVFA